MGATLANRGVGRVHRPDGSSYFATKDEAAYPRALCVQIVHLSKACRGGGLGREEGCEHLSLDAYRSQLRLLGNVMPTRASQISIAEQRKSAMPTARPTL